MKDKLKKILKELLHATQPFMEAAPVNDAKFLNVLLGIYRSSFATLRDIYYLSDFENTGASSLDLSRKISEYAITVEYMIMKGKEKMAADFQDYIFVQVKDDIDFFKSIGQDPKDLDQEMKNGAERMGTNYNKLPKRLKGRKTWAGRSMDGMLEDLYKNGVMAEFDFSRISKSYVDGSRCNHPNPFVVRYYLGGDAVKEADDYYSVQAILMAIILYLRLTTRYLDEIRLATKDNNIYKDVENSVTGIYKQINDLK